MKHQKKRVKRKQKINSMSPLRKRPFTRINDPDTVTSVLVYANPDTTIPELAKEAKISLKKMEAVIEEFQLLKYSRRFYIKYISDTDLNYYYPTVAQFINCEDFHLVHNIIIQKPHSNKIKKQIVVKYLKNNTGATLDDWCEYTMYSRSFIRSTIQEFLRIIETDNEKQILHYGKSIGFDQLLEEEGGILQELYMTYILYLNPQINVDQKVYNRSQKTNEYHNLESSRLLPMIKYMKKMQKKIIEITNDIKMTGSNQEKQDILTYLSSEYELVYFTINTGLKCKSKLAREFYL